MEEQAQMDFQQTISSIPTTAVKVITNPVGFYKEMPRTGGLVPPLVFMIAMGIVAGLVNVILALFGVSLFGKFAMALAVIILGPIFIVIFGFVGAFILFVIWKVMGSQEDFETAFRCAAYASAITPITTILTTIPYIGSLINLAWGTYLMVMASVTVHGIKSQTAWIVFGIIFVLFAFTSLGSQCASRKLSREMGKWQEEFGHEMQDMEDMSPEEAGKAVGDFLKGLQKSAEGE